MFGVCEFLFSDSQNWFALLICILQFCMLIIFVVLDPISYQAFSQFLETE